MICHLYCEANLYIIGLRDKMCHGSHVCHAYINTYVPYVTYVMSCMRVWEGSMGGERMGDNLPYIH